MSEKIQPGIYPTMSNEFYHSIEGLSSTGIRLIDDCPAKYEHRYLSDNKQDETQAMLIGSALHCKVLTPEIFPLQFAVSPKFDGRTKEGKASKAAFAAENEGKDVITEDDFTLISNIAKSISEHPAAQNILSLGGHSEESFFWEEAIGDTSVLCKCRPDLRIPSHGILVDVKTTSKGASADAFSRTIHNFGYHFQAAYYLRGVSVITGDQYDDFIFIAVETEAPYLVAVYQLDREVISLAWEKIEMLLALYVDCQKNNRWPGYSELIETISLPRWAK